MCSGQPVEISDTDWLVYSRQFNAFCVFTDAQFQILFTDPVDYPIPETIPDVGLPLTEAELKAEEQILLSDIALMADLSITKDLIDDSMIHVMRIDKVPSKPVTFMCTAINPGNTIPVMGLTRGGEPVSKSEFRKTMENT